MQGEALYQRDRNAAELRWFFREAEGDMGLRSNYGGMVQRLQGVSGGGTMRLELDGRNIAAAGRARRVKASLLQLSAEHWGVLSVAYSQPGGMVNLAGIMSLLKSTEAEHQLSRTTRPLPDWLERLGRRPTTSLRQRLYARLKGEAERFLEEALDAYSKARRR